MTSKGKLYIFTGPSGTGKGTILKRVMQADDKVRLSVSATTRAPRPGEENGVHYWFITPLEFEKRLEHDAFLEYAQYAGNSYGTPEQPVNDQLRAGYDVVLEIEVQGAMQVAKKRKDAVLIFVAPPSMQALSDRLYGRQTETEETILQRLEIAEQEMQERHHFEYIVVNDCLEDAIADLQAIFRAERCKNTIESINI